MVQDAVRLRPRQCTPEHLAEAVTEVLTSSRYRANAQHIADLLAAAPGPSRAAELLEALAAGRRPVA